MGGMKSIKIALAAVAALFAATVQGGVSVPVVCEGSYPYHLQGVATDGESVYWTFTTVLVKTGWNGKVLAKSEIQNGHMGDLCCRNGKVFIGMNHGRRAGARVGDEVWEYDAKTLELVKKHPTPEPPWCNNGIEWYGGCFWVVTSAPNLSDYNYLYVYTPDFRFRTCVLVKSGWTNLGVQTICRKDDMIMLGCYGSNGPEQPHKACTVAIDGRKLLAAAHIHEGKSSPVEISWRKDVNTSEGLLVRDGEIWEAHSVLLSKKDGKRIWTAKMFKSPGLNGIDARGDAK